MSITLNNFKKELESTILQRGRNYFKQSAITDLDEIDDGKWRAQVDGTEVYEIEINQRSDGGLEHYCSCPYDWGPVCKHIAAVLYAIEDLFPEYFEKPRKQSKPRKKRKTKRQKLEELLKHVSSEELTPIIIDLALEDRALYNQLEINFSEETSKKAYIRMVKDALKTGQGQYGFIDYWGSDQAANAVDRIIVQAKNLISQNQSNKAVPILQAVIETVIPAMNHADDSNGTLSGCIDYSIELLNQLALSLSPIERVDIFNYCLTASVDKSFSGWNWDWDLAQLAANLVTTPTERTRVFETLDTKARRQDKSDNLSQSHFGYDFRRTQKIKLSVIQRLDDPATIEKFLQKNSVDSDFLSELVQFYISQGHLEKAKEHCSKFLQGPNSQHRHYRPIFLIPLLEIAQLEGNQADILNSAQDLFLTTHDFTYYDLLKDTEFEKSWSEILQGFLTNTDKYTLPNIYIREEMWEELLAAAYQMGEFEIESYRAHLERHFPSQTCDIYSQIVYKKLEPTSSRKAYQKACRYLRRMDKLKHSEQKEQVIADLRQKYPKRRAMLEELDKVS